MVNNQSINKTINCIIITVSDTRTIETDKSGQLIKQYIEEAGHSVINHQIVKDEMDEISEMINESLADERASVILMTGGTGISQRDVTIEVVERKFEKKLPGFGEVFRMLSYTEDIGSAAMMSRAVAGVKGRQAIFAMPGSSGAVKLAMEKLILPELHHLVMELTKD